MIVKSGALLMPGSKWITESGRVIRQTPYADDESCCSRIVPNAAPIVPNIGIKHAG